MDLKQKIAEAYRDYNNNRTGFARRQREDDEYVNGPDKVTHKTAFTVTHPDHNEGKPHRREVTTTNSTKTREQAAAAARQHLEGKGFKIQEEVELDEASIKLFMGMYQVWHKGKKIASYASKTDAQDHARSLKEEVEVQEVNDYFKRRQREKDVDAGRPVKPPPKNPQNDYFARRKKDPDAPTNKKAPRYEAKDAREYDYEGDMAKSQLRAIIANAQQVHDMLEDDTNMAEWVQSKITLAADYISTVADYMQSEIKEEAKIVHTRTGANGTKYHIRQDSANDYSVHREVDGKLKHIDTYGSLQRAKSVLDNEVKEEVAQVDEVNLAPEHRAAIRRLRPSGEHSKTMLKHDSGKQIHVTREGDKVHLVTHEIGAGTGKKTTVDYKNFDEASKRGLWDNIHAKRKRGEAPAKPGDKDYPKTLNIEAMDREHPIAKEYQSMKQHDIKTLRNMIKGQHKIVDTSEYRTKDHAISAYLRHKHGDKRVAAAMGLKEEATDTRIWEAWSMGKRDPQRGIKVGQQVRSYDFPGMHDDHYIEGHVVGETPHSYHIRTNRVVRGGKEVPVPAHMSHIEAPKGRGMFSGAYGVHKIMAKQNSVAAQPQPAQGAAKSFAAVRGKK